MSGLKPVIGYLHRNHEKIGERNTFLQNMPFTDRLDYFNSMSNNFGYAMAVEKLMKIPVPERAEYIRVIMAELSRIQNHLCSSACCSTTWAPCTRLPCMPSKNAS